MAARVSGNRGRGSDLGVSKRRLHLGKRRRANVGTPPRCAPGDMDLPRISCSRPFMWWRVDAPEEPIPVQNPRPDEDHRRRIGGIGTPAYEVLNIAPCLSVRPADRTGSPRLNDRLLQLSRGGRAWATHRHRLSGGAIRGLAPRADDPPTFESQAMYLDRHGLLTADRTRPAHGRCISAGTDHDP